MPELITPAGETLQQKCILKPDHVRPYAFLFRFTRSAAFCCGCSAVSRLFFNAAKMSTTWPVRRGADGTALISWPLLSRCRR
jgi:hypothetical protein